MVQIFHYQKDSSYQGPLQIIWTIRLVFYIILGHFWHQWPHKKLQIQEFWLFFFVYL